MQQEATDGSLHDTLQIFPHLYTLPKSISISGDMIVLVPKELV